MQNQKWMTWAILGLAIFFFLSFVMPFAGWHHAQSWEAMRTGMDAGNSMHGFMHESVHGGWGFGPFGLLIGVASIFFRLGLLILMLFGVFLFWQKANGSLDASNRAPK